MSVSEAEAAPPTLHLRGLLAVARPFLIAGGRAVDNSTEVFVGINVAKARNAIADRERGGKVRSLGEVDASGEDMRRFVQKLAAKHGRSYFCYEIGPTGYGLHRPAPYIAFWSIKHPNSVAVKPVVGHGADIILDITVNRAADNMLILSDERRMPAALYLSDSGCPPMTYWLNRLVQLARTVLSSTGDCKLPTRKSTRLASAAITCNPNACSIERMESEPFQSDPKGAMIMTGADYLRRLGHTNFITGQSARNFSHGDRLLREFDLERCRQARVCAGHGADLALGPMRFNEVVKSGMDPHSYVGRQRADAFRGCEGRAAVLSALELTPRAYGPIRRSALEKSYMQAAPPPTRRG